MTWYIWLIFGVGYCVGSLRLLTRLVRKCKMEEEVETKVESKPEIIEKQTPQNSPVKHCTIFMKGTRKNLGDVWEHDCQLAHIIDGQIIVEDTMGIEYHYPVNKVEELIV